MGSNSSTYNASKTEFIVFSKPHKNLVMENLKFEVKGQSIRATNSIKYLGVYLDRNLVFQEEVKHILRQMSCGIKAIYSIRNYFPMKTCLLLLNTLRYQSPTLSSNTFEWYIWKLFDNIGKTTELGN